VILLISDSISFTWWCSDAVKVWWDILLPHYCYLSTECVSKRILKISQYWTKIWTISAGVRELEPPRYKSEAPIAGRVGAEPLAGSKGSHGEPPEAETLLAFGPPLKVTNFTHFKKIAMQKIRYSLSFQTRKAQLTQRGTRDSDGCEKAWYERNLSSQQCFI